MLASINIDREKRKIKAGDFEFYLVQDGYYRLDGGSMYGMVPKPIWEKFEEFDERNRLYMCLNCLLARRGDQVFLVDTGIGDKLSDKGKDIFGIEKDKNLLEELAEVGVTPDMVTHVILTHLHFDHAGWVVDNDGNLTFPNAKYYVQADEWNEALNPHVRFKDSYRLPYYEALKGTDNLQLVFGDAEIEKNVWVFFVPGHSRGHQVAMFDTGKVKIAHMGDIAAMATMVRQNWTCGFDRAPEETIDNKRYILEKALEENWLVVTAHDRKIRVGRMIKKNGKYHLEKVL